MQLTKGGRNGGKVYRQFVAGMNTMHSCIETTLAASPGAKASAQRLLSAIHKIVYDEMQIGNDPRVDFLLNGLRADDRVEAIV